MRGEIVVDLRAGCSKLVVDSVRALSDESLFSFTFMPEMATMPAHRNVKQKGLFAFLLSGAEYGRDNQPSDCAGSATRTTQVAAWANVRARVGAKAKSLTLPKRRRLREERS